MVKKSQVSAEFFVFLGMAFLIAVGFEISSLSKIKDLSESTEQESLKDLALSIQTELTIASNVEDGYHRRFTIPDKIGSINYSIYLSNNTLSLQSKNGLVFLKVPTFTGSMSKGTNNINKTGGVIYIN